LREGLGIDDVVTVMQQNRLLQERTKMIG